MCYARALDKQLVKWEKLCYAADAVASGGRITNPVCSWCTPQSRCAPHSKATNCGCPARCPCAVGAHAGAPARPTFTLCDCF